MLAAMNRLSLQGDDDRECSIEINSCRS
jgi:hypothetical protein